MKAMNKTIKDRSSSSARVWPRPGDFPPGSMKSRAAARRMILNKRAPETFILYDDEPEPPERGEKDTVVRIIGVGHLIHCHDAQDTDGKQGLTAPNESVARPSEESQHRTHADRVVPKEETSDSELEAAREARVLEYGKYLTRQGRVGRQQYRRFAR